MLLAKTSPKKKITLKPDCYQAKRQPYIWPSCSEDIMIYSARATAVNHIGGIHLVLLIDVHKNNDKQSKPKRNSRPTRQRNSDLGKKKHRARQCFLSLKYTQ